MNQIHKAAPNHAINRISSEDSLIGFEQKALDTTPADDVKVIRKSAKKYRIGKNCILSNLDDSGFTADDGAKNLYVSYDEDDPKTKLEQDGF